MCLAGKVKFEVTCLDACPVGYYNNNGVCAELPPNVDCIEGCSNALLMNGICDEVCNVNGCNADN